jgi:hypothetical protein
MVQIIGSSPGEFKHYLCHLLLRLDHNDLLHPWEFSVQFLLQALDQGYPRDVSTPAEPRGRDLDRTAIDAREGHISHAGTEPLCLARDDRLDLFYLIVCHNYLPSYF